MSFKNKMAVLGCCLSLLTVWGCQKDFLEKKPATNISVPNNLNELQLLLNNSNALYRSPVLGELSADDYYMTSAEFANQFLPYYANAYSWAADVFAGGVNINDWNQPYTQVLYSNVVLQQLEGIQRTNENAASFDRLKGTAHFLRAWSFFDLAQVFAMPYQQQHVAGQLGIPLKLKPDIDAPTTRASLADTYAQIIEDAHRAKQLLPQTLAIPNGSAPAKNAAYAFLARLYLSMQNYNLATQYADSALMIKASLIDYNTLSTTAAAPMGISNDEMIFQSYLAQANPASNVITTIGYSIDSLLYQSYEVNDLRRSIFFQVTGKNINKKRGYSGSTLLSNGLATDEMYLIRAEGYARMGKLGMAETDLNTLLAKRYKTGTFVPIAGLNQETLLERILSERRKELVWRGLRWNDIRRLNVEGRAIELYRKINGITYTLPPNDRRYALPIPPDVIALTGITQNER
ncbi:MAG: RagB/SusD family nutrient uptake outer membrane protein [Sphingobacteriales bacterium]|nr:MAG: RagB/SusD family nutrient uptake outer membrane protein [Sphingobacteriales bacterium]